MSEVYNRMFPSKTPLNQVDPDAPGTPGKPGYEPKVQRKELDDKGKKIYDGLRNKKGYYDMDGVPNVPTSEKMKYPEIQAEFVALSKEKLSDKDYKKKFKEKFVNDSVNGNDKRAYLLD